MEDNRIQYPLPADVRNNLAPTTVRNNLAPMTRPVEVDERDILMGEYMMPPMVKNWSSIIYLPYGHDNFQLRPDVINLFSNSLSFYGRTNENLYYHISRFDEYCRNFK
ncbi:Uncharacterized protein Adt_03303 [Abeliophyllum distichum]|uniref:Uncharacterized protein n=1 Tax=Abeliophyllum distichum TaxID=126358 RepID=A0ABD1VY45_9LAMI